MCKKKLKRTLDIHVIMDANSVKQNKCDDILLEYYRFFEKRLRVPCELESLRTLTLEVIEWTLFYEAVGTAPDYSQIWKVAKLILIFSHGEAGVERGFCVNRNVEK